MLSMEWRKILYSSCRSRQELSKEHLKKNLRRHSRERALQSFKSQPHPGNFILCLYPIARSVVVAGEIQCQRGVERPPARQFCQSDAKKTWKKETKRRHILILCFLRRSRSSCCHSMRSYPDGGPTTTPSSWSRSWRRCHSA